MVKLWKFVPILIVLAVCLGLLLVPAVPTTLAVGPPWDAGLVVTPSKAKVGFNESFTVDVSIDNSDDNDDVNTVGVMINFTPGLINVTGITVDPLWTLVVSQAYNNTAGTITVAAGILGSSCTTSSVPVCTINMTSNNISGIAHLNIVTQPGVRESAVLTVLHGDILNWNMVVNGTVGVGVSPTIAVSPDSLTFNAIEGGEDPPDQMLEVCNSGNGTVDWSLSDGGTAWLGETPTSGSLAEDQCEDVTVSVDVTGMEAGDYSATITITGSAQVQVPVYLHIESAAPVLPAGLSASSLSITPQQVEPGQEVTISINVANTGGETGSYDAILYINGAVEDSQSVSVAAGTSKNVIFTVSKSKAGVYDVSLAGQSGQFEVVGTGGFGGGLGTGGIVAIVVIVIVLIVALFLILRRTRKEV